MTFGERMKDLLEQGWAASKDIAEKAGAKAQEIGERSVLMIEIKQLELQAQKLIVRLGNETYISLVERNKESLNRDSTEIKSMLEQLAILKSSIEKKEIELKNRKLAPALS